MDDFPVLYWDDVDKNYPENSCSSSGRTWNRPEAPGPLEHLQNEFGVDKTSRN